MTYFEPYLRSDYPLPFFETREMRIRRILNDLFERRTTDLLKQIKSIVEEKCILFLNKEI